jgi:hypothetical protein
MPGWAKVLIIIVVLIVLAVVGTIAAGAYWWSRNRDALLAKGKAVLTEGVEAGRNTDNQGCVDQSLARYKTEPGFTSSITTTMFMQSCLQVSRPTPGFCDEVPKQDEIMKSVHWRIEQCKRVDLSTDRHCQQLFAPVQVFCEGPQLESGPKGQ